jgi:hypothetical protein
LEVVRRLVGKGEPNLQEIVFLVDHIPLLMEMEARDSERQGFVQEFWQDLDELQRGVRFVFTARNDEFRVLRKRRLENRATDFLESLEIIGLGSIDGRQRRCWVCALFKDYYPDYAQEPLEDFYSFFEEQAGGHPTLMSLAGHALIKALRVVTDEEDHRGEAMRLARQTLDAPRRELFNYLLKAIDRQQARDLQTLAQAVAIEDELALLVRDLRDGDPNALRRWEELLGEVNPREYLHQETLRELEDDGYVVRVNGGSPDKGAPAQPQFEERLLSSRWSEFRTSRYQAEVDDYQKKWQFTARPLAQYVQEYFRASRGNGSGQEPKDVVISLFGGERALNGEGPADRPPESDGSLIWTTLHTRGARVISAQKPFPLSMRQEFLAGFGTLLDQLLHPTSQGGEDRGGPFRNLEEVGSLILSQFTTVDIKRHLQELPIGSTVLLMMDESLKEIPWELMLEPAYAGEIPFRVGRVVVSPEQPQFLEPRGRAGKVKALLIGNPGGDLKFAETEVKWLRKRLERDGRFAQPDVLIGPEECRRIPLLNRLASGEYGLIHYSGHTFYDGERSAWLLSRDGQDNGDNLIRTEQLTSALQMGPPAIVFSSSCESAATGEEGADAGGGLGRMRYENQTFDLPSAFLQAGVEAYIGTLWEVGDGAALDFVQDFYTAFLNATCDLGECLRRAKSAQKQRSGFRDRIMWLSFILYGDPHIAPGDLFPILRSLAAPA